MPDSLPSEVACRRLTNGFTYDLPRRPLARLRWLSVFLIVFGVAFYVDDTPINALHANTATVVAPHTHRGYPGTVGGCVALLVSLHSRHARYRYVGCRTAS